MKRTAFFNINKFVMLYNVFYYDITFHDINVSYVKENIVYMSLTMLCIYCKAVVITCNNNMLLLLFLSMYNKINRHSSEM